MINISSNHRVVERRDGFSIYPEDGLMTDIKLLPTHLVSSIIDPSNGYVNLSLDIGFYDLRSILGETSGDMRRELRKQWGRLIKKVDSRVLAVHRAICAATLQSSRLLFTDELYECEHLVQDIISFRAAAIAAANIDTLWKRATKRKVMKSPLVADLRNMATANGIESRLSIDYELGEPTVDEALGALDTWRELFSPTGKSYVHLDMTLANLPSGIPHDLVCKLSEIELQRPFTSRLELLALLCSVGGRWTSIFHDARESHIKVAMEQLRAYTQLDLDLRDPTDVGFLEHFLWYAHESEDSLICAVDSAISRYRHSRAWEAMVVWAQTYAEEDMCMICMARPPIPLPDVPGVRFLDTFLELYRQEVDFGRPAIDRVKEAERGELYLFEIRRDDVYVTFAVTRDGSVWELFGPCPGRGRVNRWGRRILEQWARDLPHHPANVEPDVEEPDSIPF